MATELLENLYKVNGWEQLNNHQRDVLFLVYQDHAKVYEGARLELLERVVADPENPNQVNVHYQTEWYHYGIDTRTGRSIWF